MQSLGITRILIHRYSSILSAYGLALADRVYEQQEPNAAVYGPDTLPELNSRLDGLAKRVSIELERQGFEAKQVNLERMLHMRFDGSDTSLMISEPENKDWEEAFKVAYKTEFGFLLESQIVVDDVKVKGVGKAWSDIGQSVFEEVKTLRTAPVDISDAGTKVSSRQEVYVAPPGQVRGERVSTPVFILDQLEVGDVVEGPALVIDATQTIFINA